MYGNRNGEVEELLIWKICFYLHMGLNLHEVHLDRIVGCIGFDLDVFPLHISLLVNIEASMLTHIT